MEKSSTFPESDFTRSTLKIVKNEYKRALYIGLWLKRYHLKIFLFLALVAMLLKLSSTANYRWHFMG